MWSLISSGLIAAFLVTGGIYFFGVTEGLLGGSKASRRVSKQSGGYYDTQYYGGQYGDPYGGQYGGQYQDRWGRRQDGVSQQLDKIMSALSVDSVQVSVELMLTDGVLTSVIMTGYCVRYKARHPRQPLLGEG